jgi:hypothetical protein
MPRGPKNIASKPAISLDFELPPMVVLLDKSPPHAVHITWFAVVDFPQLPQKFVASSGRTPHFTQAMACAATVAPQFLQNRLSILIPFVTSKVACVLIVRSFYPMHD